MADFNLAITIVLKNEGGYINDPADPGGETNFGISKRSYPQVDIKALTSTQAAEIYLRDFWLFTGITSQTVANKLFDMYVNAGHSAIKIAQRATGVLITDGVYGPKTEYAINAMHPGLFLDYFKAGMVAYYKSIAVYNPAEAKFLSGWLRRAAQ